tara:strand:- start:306 stop:515 length:210 start_codon:yes stop_codon:yes gene_type:complete
MTDNELIYMIWGIDPLKEQFEIAPYSLTSDDMKLLKNQELFEIQKSEELHRQMLTPTSKENTLEVTIVK